MCVGYHIPWPQRPVVHGLGSAVCTRLTPQPFAEASHAAEPGVFLPPSPVQGQPRAEPAGDRQPGRDCLPGIGFCHRTDHAAVESGGRQAGCDFFRETTALLRDRAQ